MRVDKKVPKPSVLRDGCIEVFHATHPGQLGMTQSFREHGRITNIEASSIRLKNAKTAPKPVIIKLARNRKHSKNKLNQTKKHSWTMRGSSMKKMEKSSISC